LESALAALPAGEGSGDVAVAALADSVGADSTDVVAVEGLGVGASAAGVVALQPAASAIEPDRERAQSARGTDAAVFMVVSVHGCSPAGLDSRGRLRRANTIVTCRRVAPFDQMSLGTKRPCFFPGLLAMRGVARAGAREGALGLATAAGCRELAEGVAIVGASSCTPEAAALGDTGGGCVVCTIADAETAAAEGAMVSAGAVAMAGRSPAVVSLRGLAAEARTSSGAPSP